MKKGIRNGEVEILRLVLAIIIVLYHARIFSCSNGWLCTDAFFIISGLLLALSIKKYDGREIAEATWEYMKHRYARFWKYFLGAFALTMAVQTIYSKLSLGEVVRRLFLSIPEILFIDRAGLIFDDMFYVGASWFLSIIILCDWIMFPLLLKYSYKMISVICPVIALTGISYLYSFEGTIKFETGFLLAFIRGMSEMCIGCFCFFLAEQTYEKVTDTGKKFFTIISLGIYVFFTVVCFENGIGVELEIVALVLIAAGMVISFGNNNLLAEIKTTKIISGGDKLISLFNPFGLYTDVEIAVSGCEHTHISN